MIKMEKAGMSDIKEKIVSELSKISGEGIYSVVSQKENYKIIDIETVRFITNSNQGMGIYVSLCMPHCTIVKEFEKQNIDTKKLFFIDNTEDGKGCGAHNCIFLGRNKSLTALSLAITETCKNNSIKYLILDSIDILLIYNDLELTKRFIHYFINKIKSAGILTIIIIVEDPVSKKLMPILFQLSDGVINI